eukprot:5017557-Amphidinium_carterae.1
MVNNASMATSLRGVVERLQDIDLQDGDGRTLLWWIAGSTDNDLAAAVVEIMLAFGAHADMLDYASFGPLGRAAAAGNLRAA